MALKEWQWRGKKSNKQLQQRRTKAMYLHHPTMNPTFSEIHQDALRSGDE